MDNDMMLPESREHLDLGPIGLPVEEAVSLELPSNKTPCSVKTHGNAETTQQSNRGNGNLSRKSIKRDVKDDIWMQTTEKSTAVVQEQQNVEPACSVSSVQSEMSTQTLTLSAASRSRSKKRHDCKFEGCSFSTCYLKDLVRHTRRHTGKVSFINKLQELRNLIV